MERRFPNGKVFRLTVGDITQVPADAIVNAANSALAGGGGVDGAIHRAGGPSIMEELNEIRRQKGGCPTGSAVVTRAGRLPAQYVFHAVGPIYRGGSSGEAELLASCYRAAMALAEQHRLESISFPSISTGAYGYPVREAACIAVKEVCAHLERPGGSLRQTIFVLFSQADYEAYTEALEEETGEDALE